MPERQSPILLGVQHGKASFGQPTSQNRPFSLNQTSSPLQRKPVHQPAHRIWRPMLLRPVAKATSSETVVLQRQAIWQSSSCVLCHHSAPLRKASCAGAQLRTLIAWFPNLYFLTIRWLRRKSGANLSAGSFTVRDSSSAMRFSAALQVFP